MQFAAKTSFLATSLGAQRGSATKKTIFEDEYRGAESQTKLQGYVGEPLIRSTVDAVNDVRKHCLLIYNTH